MRGDYASYNKEQRYISEPIEIEYLKLSLLNLLGIVGIQQLACWGE
jgi:hypothetical protein